LTLYGQDVRIAFMDVAPMAAPNGHTVVLFHGNNFAGFYFGGVIDALRKEGFRVIVPDQIGFGRSSKPIIPYNFHDMARNTFAILQNLKIAKAMVVGHSMGGMLAARFASQYPDVVERVDVEVAEVLVEHDRARRRLADAARVLEHRPVRSRLDDGLEEQADLLLEGESTEQVRDPVLDGKPGVLVGIHPAVAVEVAVGDAVLGGVELGAHGRCLSSGGVPWPPDACDRAARRGGSEGARVRRPGWRRTPRCR
jgi:pimeloyl-ACP methyl ester carboxylesterase